MRELTQSEFHEVAGSGFIATVSGNVAGFIGNSLYTMIPEMGIKLPIIGTINIKDYFPDLGQQLGEAVGWQIGSWLEGGISNIPLIGGLLNKLLGN